MNWEKAERLMEIMYQEDKARYDKGEELIYHTKEDFEEEMKERVDKKPGTC